MAEVTLLLTKSEVILLATVVGQYYRILIETGSGMPNVGRQELATLLNRLNEASRLAKEQRG